MSRRAGLRHLEQPKEQGPLRLAKGLAQTATAWVSPKGEKTLTALESIQNHGVLPKPKGA